MTVKEVQNLIKHLLNETGNIYVSHECKSLLANGENYGSTMYDLKINLINKNGKEEVMCCVAKTCPPKGILWEIFNIPVTVKKELALYQIIVPTLNNFGSENRIENIWPFFAKCYGGRISLDPTSDTVDTDAVLLFENLKVRGFVLGDRFMGFNLEESRLLLKNLALFHAVPLAHILRKPQEFNEKIRCYLNQDMKFFPPPDMITNVTSFLRDITNDSPNLSSVMIRVEQNFQKYGEELVVNPPKYDELFGTIVHNDFWVNNAMLKYENNVLTESVMLDFQGLDYNSPAHDLLFFLYTSVELAVIENNFDNFVKYYFDVFIGTLDKLGCETKEFTLARFIKEMGFIATNYQLFHILLMLQPIYMKKEEAKDLSEMQEVMVSTTRNSLHDNFAKKVTFVLSDFVKRNWL